jgi:hypothetical protein
MKGKYVAVESVTVKKGKEWFSFSEYDNRRDEILTVKMSGSDTEQKSFTRKGKGARRLLRKLLADGFRVCHMVAGEKEVYSS